jgi:hypothetical protein
MNMLFWICLVFDLLFLGLISAGTKFRASFGAGNDFNNMAMILLVLILIAAVMTRILVSRKWVSLVFAALPVLLLLLLFLLESKSGTS